MKQLIDRAETTTTKATATGHIGVMSAELPISLIEAAAKATNPPLSQRMLKFVLYQGVAAQGEENGDADSTTVSVEAKKNNFSKPTNRKAKANSAKKYFQKNLATQNRRRMCSTDGPVPWSSGL